MAMGCSTDLSAGLFLSLDPDRRAGTLGRQSSAAKASSSCTSIGHLAADCILSRLDNIERSGIQQMSMKEPADAGAKVAQIDGRCS